MKVPSPAVFEDRSYLIRTDHYGWPADGATSLVADGQVPEDFNAPPQWTVRSGNIAVNAAAGILILIAAAWVIERLERVFRAFKTKSTAVRSELTTNV